MVALEQFRLLAKEFHRAAETGDLESMDGILARRRDLLTDLRTDRLSDDEKNDLVREILAFDRKSEAALQRQRAETAAELRKLDQGKRGLSGYGGRNSSNSKWIDERG